jgi:hypothetical protein
MVQSRLAARYRLGYGPSGNNRGGFALIPKCMTRYSS